MPPFLSRLPPLLLVAFRAVGRVAGLERLFAIVAGAAVLACIHIGHGDLGRALFHLKQLGIGMAVGTFQTLVRMRLAVKRHLAHGPARVLDRFPGRSRHDASDHQNCPQNQS
jgi:hypothetical protein